MKTDTSGDAERVYKFVKGYWDSNGEAPSQSEIRDYCGFGSLVRVSTALDKLEAAGRIRRKKYSFRGIFIEESKDEQKS